MFDLFYGKVKIEGKNQGIEFSREEQFGQWPLQICGFSDIHESLEASTAHEFIDTCSQTDLQVLSVPATGGRKSGQERWFTKLPPVLFFELSRFQFNQSKGVAEKINNFLDFPDVIYMDRYLEANKSITRAKREEVKALKEKRERLRSQQQAFLEYGTQEDETGPRIPLVSILSRTMQFARSGTPAGQDETTGGGGCAVAPEPDVTENNMDVDSPCPSPSLTPASSMQNLDASAKKSPLKTLADGSVQIPIKVEQPGEPSVVQPTQPVPMEVEATPAADEAKMEWSTACDSETKDALGPKPRYVSELEVKVLSACLARWRKEVEDDLASLSAALVSIDEQIKEMYSMAELKKKEYRLHAVMVHEGDVNQGHYWAYVYHPSRKTWLKFNDNTVTESSWPTMKRESAGGRMTTSAYSMIYIDTSQPHLVETSNDPAAGSVEAATREVLQDDLEQYVQTDNKLFATEILEWAEQPKDRPSDPDLTEGVLIGDDPECQIIETKSDLSKSHALLAQSQTVKCARLLSSKSDGKPSLAELSNEIYTYASNCRVKGEDFKLDSFLHYVLDVGAPEDIIKRAVLEQILVPVADTNLDFYPKVAADAKEQLIGFGSKKETLRWHKTYHNFR